MKETFLQLWDRIGAKGNPEKAFAQLQTLYSEPHRYYHNQTHVQDCLKQFSQVKKLAGFPDQLEFAIWYHDAIYNTENNDNEEKSAQLAYDICLSAQLSEDFARNIYDMILATKHNISPPSIDAELLVDIDLSILGKPRKEFDEYERNIQKEYSWVPEDIFREERRLILQEFLDRETIYTTDFFRKKYETQARENLKRSIAMLS